jgi:UDP-N-acetylmuramoyl-L-alanyl-D-glutamate--2,6-diaminopimelate ligase
LDNVLQTIKRFASATAKVITVIGCGGDRDRAKRPLMASIAATVSDEVILTSDNPRTEDPNTILLEMRIGIDNHSKNKVLEVVDRREAILLACSHAGRGDIILIAGKGHEKYQEIAGTRYPFDDAQVVRAALR